MIYKKRCQMFKHLVKEKAEAEAVKAAKDDGETQQDIKEEEEK